MDASSPSSPSSARSQRPSRPIPDVPQITANDTHDPSAVVNGVSITDLDPAAADTDLTPLRAHYLKKSLIQLQFARELDQLTTGVPSSPPTPTTTTNPLQPPAPSTLSYLGPPFSPPPKGAPTLDLPLLKYIFRQFVLTFPFMAAAPKDFYASKLQPFVASVLARNLGQSGFIDLDIDGHGKDGDNSRPNDTDTEDGADNTKQPQDAVARMKLVAKIERNLSLFVGAATKLVEREEVVRLTQSDLDRLEAEAAKRQRRMAKGRDYFEVNIVSVRSVVDKGRMRSRVHDEFIIRTRRSRYADVFVARRYGDFKTLAMELQKAHPEEQIPPPPAKDRTVVTAPATSPISPTFARGSSLSSYDPPPSPGPGPGTPTTSSRFATPPLPSHLTPSRLTREKNRLTLRSYLHALLSSSTIASSPVLKSFLLSGPTSLSADEQEDARRREEADRVREDGRKRFAREIAARVDGLRGAVKSVKGDIMGKDGLTQVFGTIKVTPHIKDLPVNYQAVTEWARISMASTVFHHFVAADNASETLAGLKRIHGLMPYFGLKTMLKISNPISMIRSVLDLFLAQPFGGRSLLQRMFTSSLTEEVRVLEEEIEAVKDKVDDPIMCAKVRQFVYAPREIQEMFKADAVAEKMNLLTVVLRSAEEPVLTRVQMHKLARAHRAHAIYLKNRANLEDSDDDDGPQDEDAWLLEDLKVLTFLYSRLRDREQLIALIFEGFTAELLKDIITIFYAPLAQVYRAAGIGDSLSDMQNFINDLIKTVEQVEELSQQDPHATVQAFMDLIQRHEQSFYHFVHKVHSKGDGLFDSLMRWIELFLTVVREGLGPPISLEFLLPHAGPERTKILAEVDAVALYHYKLKVIYEDKLRRRFGKASGQTDADAEDEATQALVNGVVGEISFGDLIQGDADDLAAEETDSEEESSDEYGSSEESGSTEEDSEGSTENEKTSSEEGARRRRAVASSRPPPAPRPPLQSGLSQSSVKRAPSLQQSVPSQSSIRRTPSLKSIRSMTFSLSKKGQDVPPVPPVPRLPTRSNTIHASSSKPLPASPPDTDSIPPPTPPAKPTPSASRPQITTSKAVLKKKQKPAQTLNAPELRHIPQLLPVFTEMMRPHLRPRPITTPSP